MNDDLARHQQTMIRMLLLHILAIIILPATIPMLDNPWGNLIVAIGGLVLFVLLDRRYGSFLYWTTRFLLYMTKEIIASNIMMAWLTIQPKPKTDPGIIGIPLTVTTPIEITILSLAIAVTPGTLVVDLGRNAMGENVLYVHTIDVHDPEQFRATIKSGFERMVLKISRGAGT